MVCPNLSQLFLTYCKSLLAGGFSIWAWAWIVMVKLQTIPEHSKLWGCIIKWPSPSETGWTSLNENCIKIERNIFPWSWNHDVGGNCATSKKTLLHTQFRVTAIILDKKKHVHLLGFTICDKWGGGISPLSLHCFRLFLCTLNKIKGNEIQIKYCIPQELVSISFIVCNTKFISSYSNLMEGPVC